MNPFQQVKQLKDQKFLQSMTKTLAIKVTGYEDGGKNVNQYAVVGINLETKQEVKVRLLPEQEDSEHKRTELYEVTNAGEKHHTQIGGVIRVDRAYLNDKDGYHYGRYVRVLKNTPEQNDAAYMLCKVRATKPKDFTDERGPVPKKFKRANIHTMYDRQAKTVSSVPQAEDIISKLLQWNTDKTPRFQAKARVIYLRSGDHIADFFIPIYKKDPSSQKGYSLLSLDEQMKHLRDNEYFKPFIDNIGTEALPEVEVIAGDVFPVGPAFAKKEYCEAQEWHYRCDREANPELPALGFRNSIIGFKQKMDTGYFFVSSLWPTFTDQISASGLGKGVDSRAEKATKESIEQNPSVKAPGATGKPAQNKQAQPQPQPQRQSQTTKPAAQSAQSSPSPTSTSTAAQAIPAAQAVTQQAPVQAQTVETATSQPDLADSADFDDDYLQDQDLLNDLDDWVNSDNGITMSP